MKRIENKMVLCKIVFVTIFVQFNGEVYAKGGFNMMTTKVIQDSCKVESNELAEYMDMDATLTNPGTFQSLLNVNADIHKELPPNVEFITKGEKLNRKGVYEDTPLNIKKTFCSYIRMDKLIYPILASSGNFSKTCPIKAGMYVIKDFDVNGKAFPFGIPAGTFKVSFSYKLGDKLLVIVWHGRSVNV